MGNLPGVRDQGVRDQAVRDQDDVRTSCWGFGSTLPSPYSGLLSSVAVSQITVAGGVDFFCLVAVGFFGRLNLPAL